MGPRKVRPGLQRPASAEGAPGSPISMLLLAAAAGVLVGLAAAGGQGPFAVLRPAHPALAESRRPVVIDAGRLFPPPARGTVYRQVDVFDPPPPAPPPRPASAAPAPPPAPTSPPVTPSPVPSPTDDGGGGGDQ